MEKIPKIIFIQTLPLDKRYSQDISKGLVRDHQSRYIGPGPADALL